MIAARVSLGNLEQIEGRNGDVTVCRASNWSPVWLLFSDEGCSISFAGVLAWASSAGFAFPARCILINKQMKMCAAAAGVQQNCCYQSHAMKPPMIVAADSGLTLDLTAFIFPSNLL